MYGVNQNVSSEFHSSADYYGAAPNINPVENDGGKEKKRKKSHPFLKKSCSVLAAGVAFGLAASLVFVGVVKASGIDRALENISGLSSEETGSDGTDKAGGDGQTADAKDSDKDISKPAVPVVNMSQSADGYSIAQIAEGAKPSVVSITNKSVEELTSMFGTREYEATSVGSGIIIGQNEEELLIATNNHVVSGSEELSVCFGDDEEKVAGAKVKGTDAGNDLAIIAVKLDDLSDDTKASIKIAKLGDSDSVNVGDQVVAIGNALGYGQSVTTGIISAKDREVTIENITANLLQTDAAINPGNSGGALLNMKGEVIGINSSKFASTKVEGMGYAIPISTALPILENLMTRQTRDVVDDVERGFLGISCQNVSSDISQMYNIPQGVYILGTEAGGPGEKAGLQKGDILTAFDGISVTDYNGLKRTLQYYKAGETVDLTIQRAGANGGYEEKTVSITLGVNENTGSEQQENESGYGREDDGGNSGGGSYYTDPYSFFGGMFGN